MSLFGSNTTVTFGSVVYNLAGPEAQRPNYLKTTVLGAILNDSPSITDTIANSYMGGPGITLRTFTNWAQNSGFNASVGQSSSSLILAQTLNQAALAALIPPPAGQTTAIQTSSIGRADFTQWAEQYVAQNFPTLIGTAYTSSIDLTSNTITVVFADATTTSFVAANYDPMGLYLYTGYSFVTGATTGPLVTGTTVDLPTGGTLPSTAGWSLDSSSGTALSANLNTATRVQVTYSDGRTGSDNTTTTTTVDPYTNTLAVWERTDFQGFNSTRTAVTSLRQVMTQTVTMTTVTSTAAPVVTTATISGGVIQTMTTTVSTDSLVPVDSYRIDTQVITGQSASPINMLIYKQGSGNPAMDALFSTTGNGGDFFPFIPIRLFQTFISPTFLPDVYAGGKKALKKAINGDLDKLIASVTQNSSLSDIDNAYVVFGVSLNVVDNSCRKYIYKFFQDITAGQDLTGTSYLAFVAAWNTADSQAKALNAWFDAQVDPTNPLYGTPQPPTTPYPVAPTSSIGVNSENRPGINYGSWVTWNGIIETTGTGLVEPTAVPGSLWFEVIDTNTIFTSLESAAVTFRGGGLVGIQAVRLNWQVDANNWRYLDIYGLTHIHLLASGSVITTDAVTALADSSESGFIVPMHSGVFSSMSLIDATQMSTACAFIVFTTAVVTKTPWYASGFFKIFVIVLVIVIAVVVTIYTGGAATPGVLGTAGAVGGALGFTGTAAVIAGAVANAIAAMVLIDIITTVSTDAFGPKIGLIVGTIASTLVIGATTEFMSGVSLATNFSTMSVITNLAKLAMAVGNGIAQWVQADAQDIMNKTQDLITSYNQDSSQIQQQSDALLGSNNGIIDSLAFSNIDQTSGTSLTSVSDVSSTSSPVETPDVFLSRTLLTGTDLSDLSMSMIGSFADLTLSTDLPI